MRFALYLFYCFEAGLFLALVPWTTLWDEIFYFREHGWVRELGLHGVTRGLISGVGVALMLQGAFELVAATMAIFGRRRPPEGA